MNIVNNIIRGICIRQGLSQKILSPGTLLAYSRPFSNASQRQELDDADMPLEHLKNPYEKDKKCCVLCRYQVEVDYKNPRLLSQFLSPFTGKVYERNITGLCKTQQSLVENEIQRSQKAGYLAIMLKKVDYIKDPKICDPNRPVRPHRY